MDVSFDEVELSDPVGKVDQRDELLFWVEEF